MKPKLEIGDCVNSVCPNSGKPVSAESLTRYKGAVVGFCKPSCRDTFENAIILFEDNLGR